MRGWLPYLGPGFGDQLAKRPVFVAVAGEFSFWRQWFVFSFWFGTIESQRVVFRIAVVDFDFFLFFAFAFVCGCASFFRLPLISFVIIWLLLVPIPEWRISFCSSGRGVSFGIRHCFVCSPTDAAVPLDAAFPSDPFLWIYSNPMLNIHANKYISYQVVAVSGTFFCESLFCKQRRRRPSNTSSLVVCFHHPGVWPWPCRSPVCRVCWWCCPSIRDHACAKRRIAKRCLRNFGISTAERKFDIYLINSTRLCN